jgi:hypothetical protein
MSFARANRSLVAPTTGEVSTRRGRTHVAQVLLCELKLSFELAHASVGSQTPPVKAGAQQRYAVVAVADIDLRQLNVASQGHESNSNTA